MAILAMLEHGQDARGTSSLRDEGDFMGSICLILGMLMASGSAPAPAPTFSASIRLPVDLYSADGTHLEKGEYAVQVKQDNSQYSLVFLQDDQPKGTVKGQVLGEDAGDDDLSIPLIGTQFLRSSADPVGSEAERHFSKTGLPQYQEEKRDWKATLRVYSTSDQKEALWFFEERQSAGNWLHVRFKLLLNPK
jgi:hypothetical protein